MNISQQSSHSTSKCKNGPNCEFAKQGKCNYCHPNSEIRCPKRENCPFAIQGSTYG